MEKQHWSAPIWNLGKSFQYNSKGRRHYVYPDWGNVGAGLEVDPQQHTRPQEQRLEHDPESTRQFTKYRYKKQKDIERKFPLKRTLEFAYPLLSPKKIVSPSKVIKSKHSITGNCLDTVELNGIIYLIHPVWKNEQQQVVASRLSQGGILCELSESLENNYFFKLKKFAHLPQDETIYQIVSKEVNSNGYIVIRSQRNAELLSLGERQEFISSKCDIINNSLISDVDLNDILPGVWSLASSNGEIYLHDAHVERCTWSINLKNKCNESDLSKYQCNFGRHPMSLMVGNESAIWVCDTRVHVDAIHKKQHGVNDNTLRTLLEVKEMKKYFADFEKISSFSKLGDMPYVYVVAGSSVFVMDERNCKMPVMNWRHILNEMPSYTSRLKFGDLDFLMLADKQEKKVSVITSEWITDNYNTWCRGVSLPKHFSIASDTLNFAHKQNMWFGNQVQERFDGSWAGVASCVNPNDKAGMLFFSLYGNGDIFLQEFRVDQNDTDLPQSEPEDITQYGKDILSRWEEKAVEVSVNKLPNKSFSYYTALPFYHRVTNKTISKELDKLYYGDAPDFDAVREGLPDIESSGIVDDKKRKKGVNKKSGSNKMEKVGDIWNVNKYVWNLTYSRKKKRGGIRVENDFQHKLWLKKMVSEYISDDKMRIMKVLPDSEKLTGDDILSQYLPTELPCPKTKDLKTCEDLLANKILSVWLEDEGTNTTSKGKRSSLHKTGYSYYTSPFDITQLPNLPSKLQLEEEANASDVPDLEFDDDVLYNSRTSKEASRLSQSLPLPSRRSKTPKRKAKKQRVDGF